MRTTIILSLVALLVLNSCVMETSTGSLSNGDVENLGFEVGKLAPDFTMNDPNGNKISLSDFEGKVVLIDFWAAWCHVCEGKRPEKIQTWNKYKDKNFVILGVSLDYSIDTWKNHISTKGMDWFHVADGNGWSNKVAKQYGISSIPSYYLVDENGIIVSKGSYSTSKIESDLESLLK